MPTVKVKDIVDRLRVTLHDLTKTGWSDAELLDWYNAAIVALVSMRPDASTKTAKFLCSQQTRQTLPSEGVRLVRVSRNSNGDAIRLIDRYHLESHFPSWHDNDAPANDVEFYVWEMNEPKVFYVYPAPVSGHSIDIVYSFTPPAVTMAQLSLDTTVIAVEATFQDAIYDYMAFRAFSKDSDYSEGANRATLHHQSFTSFLQGKNDSDVGIKPNG